MRIKHNKISDAVMTQVIDSINAADDKSKAIAEGMETLAAAHDEDLINQIVEEANHQQTEDYRRSVGIRSLTKEETDFVQAVKAGPDAYRQSVTAAQADAGKLKEATDQLTSLQTKYDTERQEWAQKQQQQAYEFAVKTAAGALKFTSAAAKRDFERGAIEKALKMEGDKILGFDDYVKAYQEADPGAFAPAEDPKPTDPQDPTPAIVLPKGNPGGSEKSAFGFNFHGVRPVPKE